MKNKIVLLSCIFFVANIKNGFADALPSEPFVAISFIESEAINSYPSVNLSLKDFPQNKEIICSINRPLFGKEKQLSQFKINDLGKIVYPDNREASAIEISALGFLQGERVIATFSTLEGSAIATASFIPYSLIHEIEGSDLALSAELITIRSITNYNLNIKGLKNGEKFFFQTKSGNEFLRQELIGGVYKGFGYSPDVSGSLGGIGEVSIITNNKTLSLQLPWGYKLFEVSKHRR